jgi:pimeloyl-ACP methyl ester carboxylesterase
MIRFIGWWFLQTWPGARIDLSDSQRLELLQQEIKKSKSTYHPKDSVFFDDEDTLRLSLRSQRESFAQGCNAVLLDGKLMSSDFGFRVEDIRPDLPVQLWYGKHDNFVPLRHGEQIAARLGGRAQLRVEDETHASIPINFREEILRDLLRGT